eukprot:gene16952-20142_t
MADYEKLERSLRSNSAFLGGTYKVGDRATAGSIPRATLKALRTEVKADLSAEDEARLASLPASLRRGLLPFQLDGVRFGLVHHGRCLLADEMGVGKTVQAIALAACYMEEWPLLVVVPASLRLMWVEELERWLPCLRPVDIHVVFSSQNSARVRDLRTAQANETVPCSQHPAGTCPPAIDAPPKVVVVSYTMLSNLQELFQGIRWGFVVVDESHNIHTSGRKDSRQTLAAVSVVKKARRAVVFLEEPPKLANGGRKRGDRQGSDGGGDREGEENSDEDEEGVEGVPDEQYVAGRLSPHHVTGLRKVDKACEWLQEVALRPRDEASVEEGTRDDGISIGDGEGGRGKDPAAESASAREESGVQEAAEAGGANEGGTGAPDCQKWVIFAHHIDVMDRIQ